jgi:hypothetical protein
VSRDTPVSITVEEEGLTHARLSCSQQFNEIMPCIYSQFMEKEARQWRQIYKVYRNLVLWPVYLSLIDEFNFRPCNFSSI